MLFGVRYMENRVDRCANLKHVCGGLREIISDLIWSIPSEEELSDTHFPFFVVFMMMLGS